MQAFLLFSHQLFADVTKEPRHTVMYLVEDSRLFRANGNPAKAIFHRASLQAIRERLLVKGFVVRYLGADEHPRLEDSLAVLAREHPEVVRYFDLLDSNLGKLIQSILKKESIPSIVLPSPAASVKVVQRTDFIPTVLPPIEPNRYVEEAAHYFLRLVPTTVEISFAYPVTKGDAEEWRDLLPSMIEQGDQLEELARDLAPLLTAGLLDLKTLEADFVEAQVSPERLVAFRASLAG